MTRWTTRISLLAVFAFLAIIMIEKDNSTFRYQLRTSRYRDLSDKPELIDTHVGKLKEYKLPQTSQSIGSPLSWLNFDKKINTYYFTFYNWYFFEISFVDLSYDSYI